MRGRAARSFLAPVYSVLLSFLSLSHRLGTPYLRRSAPPDSMAFWPSGSSRRLSSALWSELQKLLEDAQRTCLAKTGVLWADGAQRGKAGRERRVWTVRKLFISTPPLQTHTDATDG